MEFSRDLNNKSRGNRWGKLNESRNSVHVEFSTQLVDFLLTEQTNEPEAVKKRNKFFELLMSHLISKTHKFVKEIQSIKYLKNELISFAFFQNFFYIIGKKNEFRWEICDKTSSIKRLIHTFFISWSSVTIIKFKFLSFPSEFKFTSDDKFPGEIMEFSWKSFSKNFFFLIMSKVIISDFSFFFSKVADFHKAF
jgi:hypothetical protein